MIFEISAIIAVLIFAILAFYIIRTLLTLQTSLKDIHQITSELTHKLRLMESTFNTIATLGDMSEEKIKNMREYEIKSRELHRIKNDYSEDMSDIILAALKLGSKYFRR
ncbi:MAG: hypothetical protein H0T62_13095 [Parachlamydiaceae bacterium]|nr:hypothetical protein [Parachlamydiaceae bacterium]